MIMQLQCNFELVYGTYSKFLSRLLKVRNTRNSGYNLATSQGSRDQKPQVVVGRVFFSPIPVC